VQLAITTALSLPEAVRSPYNTFVVSKVASLSANWPLMNFDVSPQVFAVRRPDVVGEVTKIDMTNAVVVPEGRRAKETGE
jgi:hypothetical protein